MAKRRPRIAPRKPSTGAAPDDAAAQRFVDGDRAGQRGRFVVPRADGREVVTVVAYVPLELKKKLERFCIDHDTKITAVVGELIKNFLGEK